jgi:hypothetical protein
MLKKDNSSEFAGRSMLERVFWAVTHEMINNRPCRKVKVGAQSWQDLLRQLVAERDPTLRADWDGPRCYMRIAVGGREVVIHADESMAQGDVEVSE